MLNGVLWNRGITRRNKLQIFNLIMKIFVTYEPEKLKFNNNLESKLMEFFRKLARFSRLEKIEIML